MNSATVRARFELFFSLSAVRVDLDPAVVMPKNGVVDQRGELKATCNALSSLETHTAWFKVQIN